MLDIMRMTVKGLYTLEVLFLFRLLIGREYLHTANTRQKKTLLLWTCCKLVLWPVRRVLIRRFCCFHAVTG